MLCKIHTCYIHKHALHRICTCVKHVKYMQYVCSACNTAELLSKGFGNRSRVSLTSAILEQGRSSQA